ncbi:hypothetical protein [Allorhodopirellula heiligendammensis]|uniref:HIG1 domain-containing protein n=1 Tax=Allorhodopirellula heiligendammensis TaxID=2714739 RepID=A0A5C6C358_9BACT|nr:hypothetical protein [Allorhodopirellula heiligendammensis]TWU17946.1 hypothetical protein Poly21_00980 [Allorhodopirellula heiligendammensis]|tara:strand:+ start:324 stop:533 length:210 start_codon:yes stop_codon:yes gene_type:complete
MPQFVALYVLPALAIVTYFLQLWSGFAIAGISGNNMLVDRRTKPGPYWFIMALQTVIFFAIAIVTTLNK